MKKIAFLIVAVMLSAISAWAQIPAEVTAVMDKCQAAMSNPAGLEYTMDMKVSMGPVALTNSQLVIGSKGEKNRSSMTMKVLNMSVTFLSGYDGNESWEVRNYGESDTIRISKGRKDKDDEGIDLDMAKGFRKAKMKLKDGYYEIDYSDPVDKKSELKKLSMKVSAKNYYLREMRTSAKGAKVVMTITKVKIGLSDSYFKLDMSKYPDAVVVRE
ncbi:MAG: hypothetical protein IKP21_06580 [Bacteroidales bacterium]|nr:hypothetical protein [Bacteroidales bacterium]